MKSYDETIDSVICRIHEYEVEALQKRKSVMKAVASLGCLCLVTIIGIAAWRTGLIDANHPSLPDDPYGQQGTGSAGETGATTVGPVIDKPDSPILWGDDVHNGSQDAALIHWNGKMVDCALYEALTDTEYREYILAITPSAALDEQFVHNGKTLAEYEQDAENERIWIDNLHSLAHHGEYLKYGEALYTTGAPNGEKWDRDLYYKTIARYGEQLLATYIVDGVFLKEKLEADIEKYSAQEPCREAYEVAFEAYMLHFVEESIKQLDAQGYQYEQTEEGQLIIFMTAEEFESLSLEHAMLYNLAAKNGEPGDLVTNECIQTRPA